MIIKSLASSSRGNCYLISDGVSTLMIECGIKLSEVRKHTKLAELDGCLISHEHKDHAKYAKEIAKYCEIYASKGTLESIDLGPYSYRSTVLEANKEVKIRTIIVKPFNVQHDAADPLGFLIYSTETKERLLFATDTYYINSKFGLLDYIMIECNYDTTILQKNIDSGSLPQAVAKRLFSSHFELGNVKEFLKANDLTNVKAIYLLHLSDGNSDAKRFKKEIAELTGKVVYVCDS